MWFLLIFSITFTNLIPQSSANDSFCPSGWSFSLNTSYCYTVSSDSYTWSEAVNYCQSIGGQLVNVRSGREYVFLTQLTSQNLLQPWLGYSRKSDGNFYDLTGYSAYYAYWAQGEPSGNGDCVTFQGQNNTGLRVTPCYNIQPALCKQMPALCPNTTQYGGTYTRSGVITSPGYPDQYYNNLDCLYYITSPPGTYITIEFSPWVVEYWYDYVFLFDGPDFTYPYIGEPLGLYGKNSFESSNNSLTFFFYTDSIITDKGWQATWTAKANTPPISQSGLNGSLTSDNYPNDYDSYTERIYYISTSFGFKINLTITDFITEANYDVLRVYNSSTVNDNYLVANLSGSSVAPWNYLSPSNYLTLKFTSDGSVQKQGWSLFWFMQ